jgi:hypothetical protein
VSGSFVTGWAAIGVTNTGSALLGVISTKTSSSFAKPA